MSNHNITQRRTQATGLGVIIGRCSPDSQHGRTDRHPTNVGCSFFRYTNHNGQRPKRRTWSREENQLVLECYFRSNPSQRGYRKKMMEIWQERSTFQTTRQRLADQVRKIMKKSWFSDLELLKIHQKTLKQNTNTVPDTPSGVKQKQSNNKKKKTRKPRQIKTLHSKTIHYQTTKKKHYHKNKK